MAIILDTENWLQKTPVGYLQRTLFLGLVAQWPQKQFLLSASALPSVPALPSNIAVVPFPPQKGLLTATKTKSWLRRQNATFFISFDRTLKKQTTLKQVLILTSGKKWKQKQFQNADVIAFVSLGLQQQFAQKFPAYSSKCFLLQHLVPNINPEAAANTQVLKETFSNGMEYFITADFDFNKEKLITLLKGFSVFKQMQQSSWKLMVVLPDAENPFQKTTAEQLLQNYKYRGDVVLTNDAQLIEKIAASYLLISQNHQDAYPISNLLAAKTHRPVVTNPTPTTQLILGDAAMYYVDNSSQAIGEALMQMYKDEKKHADYINKIKQIAPGLTVDTALNTLNQINSL